MVPSISGPKAIDSITAYNRHTACANHGVPLLSTRFLTSLSEIFWFCVEEPCPVHYAVVNSSSCIQRRAASQEGQLPNPFTCQVPHRKRCHWYAPAWKHGSVRAFLVTARRQKHGACTADVQQSLMHNNDWYLMVLLIYVWIRPVLAVFAKISNSRAQHTGVKRTRTACQPWGDHSETKGTLSTGLVLFSERLLIPQRLICNQSKLKHKPCGLRASLKSKNRSQCQFVSCGVQSSRSRCRAG